MNLGFLNVLLLHQDSLEWQFGWATLCWWCTSEQWGQDGAKCGGRKLSWLKSCLNPQSTRTNIPGTSMLGRCISYWSRWKIVPFKRGRSFVFGGVKPKLFAMENFCSPIHLDLQPGTVWVAKNGWFPYDGWKNSPSTILGGENGSNIVGNDKLGFNYN